MNVLSIQSHVVYGHVGNAAAVFPLQRLGFEVWPLHTLQFSNHVGYSDWTGDVFPAARLRSVLDGLERRGAFGRCDALLSGYLGDPETVALVADALARARAHRPDCVFLCDPVMGDLGEGLYVHEGIPDLMRDKLVPAADVITPNAFELSILAETAVEAVPQAVSAARELLGDDARRGPKLVVVTSLPLEVDRGDRIAVLAVSATEAWQVDVPSLEVRPEVHGGGDAFAALFLAHYLAGEPLGAALARTAGAVFGLFKASQEADSEELPLIAAQSELAAPSCTPSAVRLD